MMVLNSAYKSLKDNVKRAEYDNKRKIKSMNEQSRRSSIPNPKTSSSRQSSARPSDSRSNAYSTGGNRQSTSNSGYDTSGQQSEWPEPPDWINNVMNRNVDQSSASSESLTDVLSDLLFGVQRDGVGGILRDITDFLEEQVAAKHQIHSLTHFHYEPYVSYHAGLSVCL